MNINYDRLTLLSNLPSVHSRSLQLLILVFWLNRLLFGLLGKRHSNVLYRRMSVGLSAPGTSQNWIVDVTAYSLVRNC